MLLAAPGVTAAMPGTDEITEAVIGGATAPAGGGSPARAEVASGTVIGAMVDGWPCVISGLTAGAGGVGATTAGADGAGATTTGAGDSAAGVGGGATARGGRSVAGST